MAVVCLATLALLAGSAALGAAVWRLAGLPPAPHLTPAIGFATLLVVALPAVRLPGWSGTALAIMVLLVLASLADRRAMRAVRGGLADALPVSLIALLVLCLPFLVSGHFGILAMGNNNDWSVHLGAVRWLAHHDIPARDTLVGWGYPLGPHALAAAITATGVSEAAAFTAVMATGPILAARAALAALLPVARPWRWGLALLAGLPYLAVSYYAQAAYKEVIAGGLALAFALALPAAVRAAAGARRHAAFAAARAAFPLAILMAGAVMVLSWPAVLWPLATLGAWGALTVLGPRRRELWNARWRIAGALAGGAVAVAVLLAPDYDDIVAFQNSSFAHEPEHGLGNLVAPIPPSEGLGVWLQPDFRFPTDVPGLAIPLIVGAGVLIVLAGIHWLRRGPRVLAAALASDWVVWIALSVVKNPYNAAKGLAVMAPLIGLALVTGALIAWAPAGRARRRRRGGEEEDLPVPVAAATYAVLGGVPGTGRPRIAVLRRAAVVAVLVGAGASSFLAARDAVVGVDAHADELHALATTAQRDQTAFLDPSDYGVWDLYALRPFRPPLLYVTHRLPLRPEKNWHQGNALDFDSMTADTINRFRWFIMANTTYASTPPAGVRLVRTTRSWQLWERTGTVAPRSILPGERASAPGAVLDCSTPAGRELSRRQGTAIVRAKPIVVPATGWSGSAREAGATVTRTVDLPPGRWDLSLQYVSRNAIDVSAPGMRATLPANLDRMSPYFGVGGVRGGGPVRITVHVHELNVIGRALGSPGRTRALASLDHRALGGLAAVPHGDTARTVPLSRACGRYVDAYTLG